MQQAEVARLHVQLREAFTPSAPISEKDSLQGRETEINKVLDAVTNQGAHVAIFGERGVGKTSLAGLIEQFWIDLTKDVNILTVRVNCEPESTYEVIWGHVATELEVRMTPEQANQNVVFVEKLQNIKKGLVDPSTVRQAFETYKGFIIIIVDEFDRIVDDLTISRFADTIKGLSDYKTGATLVIVGVADTLEQLISDHASIERNLKQIPLPRLSTDDICSIVSSRYDEIELEYKEGIVEYMARFAHGFPYYAHLFGQSTGLATIGNGRTTVTIDDVSQGLIMAADSAEGSVKQSYYNAVSSNRPDSIHRDVLLACAVMPGDELGKL